nr:hypothetical protein Iba_chr09eCG9990 [Ipomoea batatas]
MVFCKARSEPVECIQSRWTTLTGYRLFYPRWLIGCGGLLGDEGKIRRKRNNRNSHTIAVAAATTAAVDGLLWRGAGGHGSGPAHQSGHALFVTQRENYAGRENSILFSGGIWPEKR